VQTDRTHIPFYGGDLKGIENHLDYLQRLGVNAIYLNPIFTAYTNHRYDVADFRNVDPTLGGNEALISLAKALKKAQMRYILDIVPNHSGAGHPWFREAFNDPSSPRRSAFFFDQEQKYVSWMGFGSLPKLNYSDPSLRSEMFESETSVFASWQLPPYSIDGWRVDVGNMLGRYNEQQLDQDVLPAIRKTVKRTNPQSYLMGENFFEAAGQLQGDTWDGVMNYTGFSLPLLNWLKGFEIEALRCKPVLKSEKALSSEALVRSWQENLAAIPWTIALQQFNVLDSHDTSRLRTELGGDEDLIRLAVMIQFTFPGVPCIYYGDEIGLVDEPGFSQRNCFPWEEEKWNTDLLAFYQRLISLRKENDVLAEGSFQMLYWDDDLLIYQRLLGGKRIVVTASRIDQPNGFILKSNLINPTGLEHLKNVFTDATLVLHPGEIKIPAMPRGGAIWL
jgi:alpha-glucosidase